VGQHSAVIQRARAAAYDLCAHTPNTLPPNSRAQLCASVSMRGKARHGCRLKRMPQAGQSGERHWPLMCWGMPAAAAAAATPPPSQRTPTDRAPPPTRPTTHPHTATDAAHSTAHGWQPQPQPTPGALASMRPRDDSVAGGSGGGGGGGGHGHGLGVPGVGRAAYAPPGGGGGRLQVGLRLPHCVSLTVSTTGVFSIHPLWGGSQGSAHEAAQHAQQAAARGRKREEERGGASCESSLLTAICVKEHRTSLGSSLDTGLLRPRGMNGLEMLSSTRLLLVQTNLPTRHRPKLPPPLRVGFGQGATEDGPWTRDNAQTFAVYV
jgi:hypothetical protein